MRKLIIVLAVMTVGAVAFHILRDTPRDSEPFVVNQSVVSESRDTVGTATSSETAQLQLPNQKAPDELVQSIYDLDLEDRLAAIKAAEDMIQHYDSNSLLRWEAIAVDPRSHLTGSYLEDGAMPESIALTPFPDISIIADQIDYQVMEHVQGAIWTGAIRGTENGRVEISVVGGLEKPGFVIRFQSFPNLISILPIDDDAEMYVAIEGNPNQRYVDER